MQRVADGQPQRWQRAFKEEGQKLFYRRVSRRRKGGRGGEGRERGGGQRGMCGAWCVEQREQ